jgi:hypothetical protein
MTIEAMASGAGAAILSGFSFGPQPSVMPGAVW